MVHPQRRPKDGLDEQAPEPGASSGGAVLRAGLGRTPVEGEAVGVCHQGGDRQVGSGTVQRMNPFIQML